MRFQILLITVLALFLCSSCASEKKWIHPYNSEDQKKQDQNECDWEAVRKAGPSPAFGSPGYDATMTTQMIDQQKIKDRCMKDRGYKEVRQ